ncbi:hypothetical protein ACVWZA_003814 [Sphingomonas sp. UYAg733]
MVQRVKSEASGLNIRIHPHSPERYRELFKTAFALKKIVNIRGDRAGMVTSLSRINPKDDFIRGVITTFLEIDLDGNWLNTETLEVASENDVESVRIPENLRPNMMSFYFRFDVQNHELIFENYSNGKRLTHNSALIFFKELFTRKKIIKDFGDVKVTILQSRGSVDRVFSIPRITSLEVYIERPNADIWEGEFEELAEEHLEEKGARSMTVIYKAESGGQIVRDDDLSALVRTSVRNGRTIARGYGPNGHEVVTTDMYPKVMQDRFNPEDMSDNQMFEQLAERFRRR